MFLNRSHRDLSIDMKKNLGSEIIFIIFCQKLLDVRPKFSKNFQEFQKNFQDWDFLDPKFLKIQKFQNPKFQFSKSRKSKIFKIQKIQICKIQKFQIWTFSNQEKTSQIKFAQIGDKLLDNFIGRSKHNLGPST